MGVFEGDKPSPQDEFIAVLLGHATLFLLAAVGWLWTNASTIRDRFSADDGGRGDHAAHTVAADSEGSTENVDATSIQSSQQTEGDENSATAPLGECFDVSDLCSFQMNAIASHAQIAAVLHVGRRRVHLLWGQSEDISGSIFYHFQFGGQFDNGRNAR